MNTQVNVTNTTCMNTLPEWDLSDLYEDPESPVLESDLDAVNEKANNFAQTYEGNLATLSADEFGEAVRHFEDLNERLSRITSYAQLLFSANSDDGTVAAFYQNMTERVTSVSVQMLFFELL